LGENKETLDFEITIEEKTNWGVIVKNFSNKQIKVDRAAVIVDVIEYLSKNWRKDYLRAVKMLRERSNLK